jgi:hypothetical protein
MNVIDVYKICLGEGESDLYIGGEEKSSTTNLKKVGGLFISINSTSYSWSNNHMSKGLKPVKGDPLTILSAFLPFLCVHCQCIFGTKILVKDTF